MATHSSILAWRIPMDRGAWRATVHGVAESDMSEQLSIAQSLYNIVLVSASQQHGSAINMHTSPPSCASHPPPAHPIPLGCHRTPG